MERSLRSQREVRESEIELSQIMGNIDLVKNMAKEGLPDLQEEKAKLEANKMEYEKTIDDVEVLEVDLENDLKLTPLSEESVGSVGCVDPTVVSLGVTNQFGTMVHALSGP